MTKVVTFTELCDLMNYDSQYTRTTGKQGDISKLQEKGFEMLSLCELTPAQKEALETYIIGNDATVDKEPHKNTASVEAFNKIIKFPEQNTNSKSLSS